MGLRGAPSNVREAKVKLPENVKDRPDLVNPAFELTLLVDGSYALHGAIHSNTDLAERVFSAEPGDKVCYL
jgi:hypothetical protein